MTTRLDIALANSLKNLEQETRDPSKTAESYSGDREELADLIALALELRAAPEVKPAAAFRENLRQKLQTQLQQRLALRKRRTPSPNDAPGFPPPKHN